MLTETIHWHEATEQLPDADLTVLVRTEGCAEPVWLGYHDGEAWRDTEGAEIAVLRWADLPAGDQAPVKQTRASGVIASDGSQQ